MAKYRTSRKRRSRLCALEIILFPTFGSGLLALHSPAVSPVRPHRYPELIKSCFQSVSRIGSSIVTKRHTGPLYEFGAFRFSPSERILLRDDQRVLLAPKGLETLLVLLETRGHIVGKDELLKRVWPGTFVEEHTVAQTVFTLRRPWRTRQRGSHSSKRFRDSVTASSRRSQRSIRSFPKLLRERQPTIPHDNPVGSKSAW